MHPAMIGSNLRRLFVLAFLLLFQSALANEVKINSDMVLLIDGKPVFPIGFTMPPPPDSTAPNGKNGIEELSEAGATFLRTGVMGKEWSDQAIADEKAWQAAAATYGMHCWV